MAGSPPNGVVYTEHPNHATVVAHTLDTFEASAILHSSDLCKTLAEPTRVLFIALHVLGSALQAAVAVRGSLVYAEAYKEYSGAAMTAAHEDEVLQVQRICNPHQFILCSEGYDAAAEVGARTRDARRVCGVEAARCVPLTNSAQQQHHTEPSSQSAPEG
jgi:hypothetical protein